jgi:hypothetical protein
VPTFSSLYEATSCDRYLANYASDIPELWKITTFRPNNFFIIGFRAKYSIDMV